MTLLLGLRNAAVTFGGDPLWTGVDLALSAGDKACLVGRNGSGKSTILKALAGAIDLDGGERFVQPGIRIAYLAQEPDLTVHATVADYVASALPADRAHDHWRVEQVLAAVKLDGNRSTGTLSGGEGGAPPSPMPWSASPTCCCWTSRPIISTCRPSNGWRTS